MTHVHRMLIIGALAIRWHARFTSLGLGLIHGAHPPGDERIYVTGEYSRTEAVVLVGADSGSRKVVLKKELPIRPEHRVIKVGTHAPTNTLLLPPRPL